MASAEQELETPPNRHVAAGGRLRLTHPPLPSSCCLMDPLSSSSTRRVKQSPTPPGSSHGLLIDPIPPASSSGLLTDTAPPAPASTAARPPKYRGIAPIPRIRRSPPFSKRLTYMLRLGRDRDGITSSALTSSLLAGVDGRGHCNGNSSRPHTSSSLATIDEIQRLTSSSSAGDESPPPLTRSSLAGDEIQHPLTISSSSVNPHPAPLTPEELEEVANIKMCFWSIMVFFLVALAICNAYDYPAVMVSEIAGILCMYMHYWSIHITQFWLNYPYNEDSGIIVWTCCLIVFIFATTVGIHHSVLAGMCITLVPTMCMAGYLISCIHEYDCKRRCQNLEQPLVDEIQRLTSSSSAGDESPPPLTRSSLAGDEIQHPLTISSSSVNPHPAPLTSEELEEVADMKMCFWSIIVFSLVGLMIYNVHDYPAVMVSAIAGILCMYMHYWSIHITQFWLNYPYNEDSCITVWLCCLIVFIFATIVGSQHSVLAGICITLVPTMCMAGYLISCIHEYDCKRRCQNFKQPLDLNLHQDEHTLNS